MQPLTTFCSIRNSRNRNKTPFGGSLAPRYRTNPVFLSADRAGPEVPSEGGAEPARALLPEGAEREAEREGPRRHRRQGAQRVPLPLPQGDRALHRVQGGGGNGEHALFTNLLPRLHGFVDVN